MRRAVMDAMAGSKLEASDVTKFDPQGQVVERQAPVAAFSWLHKPPPGPFDDVPFKRLQAACLKIRFTPE